MRRDTGVGPYFVQPAFRMIAASANKSGGGRQHSHERLETATGDPVVAELRRKVCRPCYAAARRRDWERLRRTQRMIDAMLPMTHSTLNPSMSQANCCEFAI